MSSYVGGENIIEAILNFLEDHKSKLCSELNYKINSYRGDAERQNYDLHRLH